jgi:hypothetical protein
MSLIVRSLQPVKLGCRVGKKYPVKCVNGDPCFPIEGSFVVECDLKGCNNFGK